MGLREQAYDAVEAVSFEMRDGDGASGVVYPSVAADAASDVWEEECNRLTKENERFAEFVLAVYASGFPIIYLKQWDDVLERAGIK